MMEIAMLYHATGITMPKPWQMAPLALKQRSFFSPAPSRKTVFYRNINLSLKMLLKVIMSLKIGLKVMPY